MCILADLVDILVHQDPWQGIVHKMNRMTQKFTHWKEGKKEIISYSKGLRAGVVLFCGVLHNTKC